MKRKGQRKKGKLTSSKRKDNSKLEDFFNSSSRNAYHAISIKANNKSINNTSKKVFIIRNPSKTRLVGEAQQELKKYHNLAEKTILCDKSILIALYIKMTPAFEIIDRFLKSKNYENKKLNKRQVITKFILQMKYTDLIYICPSLLSDNFNEEKISQNIRNFVGYKNKGVTMNFSPNKIEECQIFWPNITEIVTDYLDHFHEGKGLYIYVEHDYLSYLNKIKLLCNLNNYETVVIDETDQAKCLFLDRLSEAMKTKRLASISDQLGKQMLMLEEMINSFSYKWKIFSKIIENNISVKSLNNNNEDMNKSIINLNDTNNSINSSSFNYSIENKNEPIILSNKDIDKVFEEIDIKKSNNNTYQNNNKDHKNDFKLDEIDEDLSKNEQLSTNETLFMTFQRKRKNKNKQKDNNYEKNELLLKSREKSRDKSKDKSKNNSRNKSSELKKRRNKKTNENNKNNNTNIKGYFNENTKEHKSFTQLQNNIFLYCTKAKTAIIITDSFSDDEKDKKYFNNILLKVSQTKCPIIILTNNLDSLSNNSQKRIKNLNINCILSPKNKRDMTLIYFYNFVIYINIKLCELKFTKDINTYEELLEYINNIDIDLNKYELCRGNLKKIFTLSEYICYFGKFQIDIIDLRLSEIFLDVENEIKNNIINGKDFDAILNYIYNSIFNKNDNNISFSLEENAINEINEECEMRSFLDYSDGIQENLIKNNYENKLKINDSFDNFCKSKESMVNLEGLLLRKLFNNKDSFKNISNNNIDEQNFDEKNSFSIYDTFNNKIINKINQEDQLLISNNKKKFIQISSLSNYIFPIKRKIIIMNNLNKYKIDNYKKSNEEYSDFLDNHNHKKLFQKIEDNLFLNKNNINYATNYVFKKAINQKKLNIKFYEK